jgi:serine protease Do
MSAASIGEIAEKLRRSTVVVQPGQRGNGSGVIWSSNGLIVTNAHVARTSQAEIRLWDGRFFRGEVEKRDPRRDLAALRIDADDLPAASVANSSKIRPGEIVIAIGNPLGFVGALTTGVVQAVGPLHGLDSRSWVQSDVRLAPGHSGGPLANAQGRVIGINTMIAGRLALAIPSNTVVSFLAGEAGKGWLGVIVQQVRLPRHSAGVFGLVVLEVQPGSPAALSSLLPGDILLGTEEAAFDSTEDLAQLLSGSDEHVVRLRFLRGDYAHVRRVSVRVSGRRGGSIAA